MYTNTFYRESFTKNNEQLQSLVDQVESNMLGISPSVGKWSIGEIIDHLLITGDLYLNVIEKKLNDNQAVLQKGTGGPYSHPIHLRLLIKMVSPESKRAISTFPVFEPKQTNVYQANELIANFNTMQNRFLTIVDMAEHRDLDIGRIKVNNPVFGWLTMNISSCLAVNEAHQRRHFSQIDSILDALN